MPTILRKNGFRFFFYSNEGGELPHIHVEGHGCEAKLWLSPLKFSYEYRLSPRLKREILKIAQENDKLFFEKWSEWHGTGLKKN